MERFLHYLWEQRLFFQRDLHTVDGEVLEVINTGRLNRDAGPDFFNAVIRIGGIKWAGNVEIHKKASEWFQHRHDSDKSYDNVILHVVQENDVPVFRSNGVKIPAFEMRYSPVLEERYHLLQFTDQWPACSQYLRQVDPMIRDIWMTRLLIDRLSLKYDEIKYHLGNTQSHYEACLFTVLCRNFGFGLNREPMEQLAQEIPLQILLKYRNDPILLEALLFGVAGFLEEALIEDAYHSLLRREFKVLKAKHQLSILAQHNWKFLRLRPSNFPTIRLAQLADLICRSSSLFSKVVSARNLDDIRGVLACRASSYWDVHYTFGESSKKRVKHLGSSAIDLILINTILPFIFVYGKDHGEDGIEDRVISLFESVRPESNRIVKRWRELHFVVSNAFDSQALMHLHKQYCEKKACTRCKFGHEVIKIKG